MNTVPKLSFRQKQLIVRESAIVQATNRLLALKGYDLMTMDEVAAEVGIAKASLYKHFASKELLAAAAMITLLEHTLEHVVAQSPENAAIDRLRDLLRWALQLRMDGDLPTLPAVNNSLREALMANGKYIGKLLDLNELLGELIEAAKSAGALRKELPSDVVLLTIYARSCDPTVDYLKMSGLYDDGQIIDLMLATCFSGLT